MRFTCAIFQVYAISCYTGPRYIKNRLHHNFTNRAVHNFQKKLSHTIGFDTQRLNKSTTIEKL